VIKEIYMHFVIECKINKQITCKLYTR